MSDGAHTLISRPARGRASRNAQGQHTCLPAGALAALLAAVMLCGCKWPLEGEAPKRPAADASLEPLPVQQARAYGETVTGLFMSLVDFETAPGGDPGHQQVQAFGFSPPGGASRRKFVVNVTRTGAGAMEVVLVPGSRLVFRIPYVRDFTGYTLLTFALYSRSLRDDLRITLACESAAWTSHRTLVRPGWNYVLIDIQRLARMPTFDVTDVRTMTLEFTDAREAVRFNLDDIMLVNNRRPIEPVPRGMRLEKIGLNYSLRGRAFDPPVPIAQGMDGLWRLGPYQPSLQVLAPGRPPAPGGENIERLGDRRVGQVEIVESTSLRMRIVNTWYFPTQAGEWLSLAIRQVRWEHTLYADGRWVTHVELNNAGGKKIGVVKLTFPRPVAIVGAGVDDVLMAQGLPGPIGRWSYLWAGEGQEGKLLMRNYLLPAQVRLTLGDADVWADGDSDHDRFDQTRGCYVLGANRGGHCRFTVLPRAQGLLRPVFRVKGPWSSAVHVSSEGLPISEVCRLADGSALFALPGTLRRPTSVEVTGKTPLVGE